MKFLNTAIVVTALVFAMTVQAHCPPEVCNHLKKRTFPWHKNIVESFEANETEVAKIRCRGVYGESLPPDKSLCQLTESIRGERIQIYEACS
ncbi:hypothetical protein SNOG_20039 [Parastagonospora nodorum SN15]|uniref:Uncharacterized protein n=1 Tax=Phaeosphaeria nodorum (strain SN15 / ATCC MYA-4574 / FGSC 10173) TaxID=321614 RepID=A9JX37_PHANO|nr:hypothetical protein SNOG_20039 [Parastagonospora nodorum SN15]EDP89895.1 hypothetical protein SNOG_20039 [Parastagonospora nodorum SN15]